MNLTKESLELITVLDKINLPVYFKNELLLERFFDKIIDSLKAINVNQIILRYTKTKPKKTINLLGNSHNKDIYEHKYIIEYNKCLIILRYYSLYGLNKKSLIVIIQNILLTYKFKQNQNPIDIYIFPGKEKKKFGSNFILSPKEINSGYTDNKRIVIYRNEERNKVLLHELIHFLGIDLSQNDTKLDISSYINIDKSVKINLNEAFTEMMACLLNSIICSYLINKKKNKNLFKKCILYELKFSLYQVSKIIIHYGYKNANDFFKKHKDGKFDQKTSVFSYFIVKTSFLFNISIFIQFLKNKNGKDYITLVKKTLKDKHFIELVNVYINHILNYKQPLLLKNTLRMTLIEI